MLSGPEMPHKSDPLCPFKSEWHIEVVANPNAEYPVFQPIRSTLRLLTLWDWELSSKSRLMLGQLVSLCLW